MPLVAALYRELILAALEKISNEGFWILGPTTIVEGPVDVVYPSTPGRQPATKHKFSPKIVKKSLDYTAKMGYH